MPSKSQKQHDFFESVYYSPEYAKRVGVSKAVAKEFLDADKEHNLWQKKYLGKVVIKDLTKSMIHDFVVFRNKSAERSEYVLTTTETAIAKLLYKKGHHTDIYVATIGRDIVGQLFLEATQDKLRIQLISVLKEDGIKGVGHKLLKYAEDVALHKKLNAIELWVHQKNISAIAFYERMGFKRKAFSRSNYLYTKTLDVASS